MSTQAITPDSAALAVADLIANLSQSTSSYVALIQNIDERLTMPLPEAGHPLSQAKLEIIWGLYCEVISARKENAVSQLELFNHVIIALTHESDIAACGELLSAMQTQLPTLQAQAKEWDTISMFLAKEIVVLAPHLEALTR